MKRDLLPHLGSDNKNKIHFLGLMINKLIKCYMGLIQPSNRDSYQNKRMEPAGILMGNLIYQGMNKIVKDIKIYNLPYLKQEVQSLVMWLKDNPLC